jgi:hypothetical protein
MTGKAISRFFYTQRELKIGKIDKWFDPSTALRAI